MGFGFFFDYAACDFFCCFVYALLFVSLLFLRFSESVCLSSLALGFLGGLFFRGHGFASFFLGGFLEGCGCFFVVFGGFQFGEFWEDFWERFFGGFDAEVLDFGFAVADDVLGLGDGESSFEDFVDEGLGFFGVAADGAFEGGDVGDAEVFVPDGVLDGLGELEDVEVGEDPVEVDVEVFADFPGGQAFVGEFVEVSGFFFDGVVFSDLVQLVH